MSDFAILRFAKLTSLQALAGASAHNTRTATAGIEHADSPSPMMDGGIQLLQGHQDAVEAWRDRTKAVGLGKVRKDAVRAVEAVLSASPAWFVQASAEERSAWVDQSMDWAACIFQSENILQATLHDDEETMHLHILAVPLVQKERKKAGRPKKNRRQGAPPMVRSWGLSAADLIGSREQLTALQTSYAEAMAGLGIRRGRPRRTTGSRHRSAHSYRTEAAEDRFSTQVVLADAEASARGKIFFAELEAREIEQKAYQGANQIAEAMSLGLEAIDAGELVFRPGNDARPAGLAIRKISKPRLPSDRTKLWKWRKAVRPVFSCLVRYAARMSLVSAREREVEHRSQDLAVEAEAIRRVADRQAARENPPGSATRDAAILSRSREARVERGISR